MPRHKSRGRRSRKGRAGTRKQAGGWILDWIMGKKTGPAAVVAAPPHNTVPTATNTGADADKQVDPNAAPYAPAPAPAPAPGAAVDAPPKPWWRFGFGGGGRRKSRKTRHRRRHHRRK